MQQQEIDNQNTEFWNELCGTNLASSIGITEITPETLRRYDEAYMNAYPYLAGYVLRENMKGKKVLEIGLGYGTLGQFLASQSCDYCGLDIAQGPVDMMRFRLAQLGLHTDSNIQVGSALDIPHANNSFDYVYTIGCLHHTGNLPKSILEVCRVLVPGGKAVVMLYHRHSFAYAFRYVWACKDHVLAAFVGDSRKTFSERLRSAYDADTTGSAAPHIDFVSRAETRQLFKQFSRVKIDIQNFVSIPIFPGLNIVTIPREKLLNNMGRVLGSDLYITAQK